MKKTVGVLDDVVEYGQRLVATINTRKGSSLSATFISDPFEVKEKIADHKLQLLLVSEQYACQMEGASIPMYILVSDLQRNDSPDPSEKVISRYSNVNDIVEKLLSEVEEKRQKELERLIVVFSPDSVDESVKRAVKIAEEQARLGKTLYLPFDNFMGTEGKKSITELLYRGLGSKDSLNDLMSSVSNGAYDAFGGPEYFSDMWQYTEDQMDRLLKALLDMDYQHLVIAAGFMSDAIHMLFKRCDVIYIPALDSPRSIELIRQLTAAGAEDIVNKIKEAP